MICGAAECRNVPSRGLDVGRVPQAPATGVVSTTKLLVKEGSVWSIFPFTKTSGVEQGVCSGYLPSSPHIPTSVSVRPFFGLSGPSRASATQTTGCWTFLFLPAGLGPQSSRRVALPNRAFSSFTFPVRFVAWKFLYTDTQTAVQ